MFFRFVKFAYFNKFGQMEIIIAVHLDLDLDII